MSSHTVTVKIEITGHRVALFSPRGGDFDSNALGWAVLGYVTIRMKFGSGRVRSKQLRASHKWTNQTGWPRLDRPSDDEIQLAHNWVLVDLREECRAHGFDPGELNYPLEPEEERDAIVAEF